ncbi:rRNA maturation RNase YbeY [Pedobacter sp. SYSU D00535]|uniref:rRNA maturation RNase YbeY n=1 Tax=Pedobacter sp. SYSU D00535 TaxID=2810308 RepID=UPI001A95EDB7|nr:rRNA maturation RNase YbeY [Pedobacter sp. SYSU D00535]
MGKINFFTEDLTLRIKDKIKLKSWIRDTINREGKSLGELNFIFCSDEYLLRINQEYLNHDTLTDIITFDNSDAVNLIVGDVFISYERVHENADRFEVNIVDELHRVIIHGTLHLLGYKDKSKDQKALMTQKEDQYLALREF